MKKDDEQPGKNHTDSINPKIYDRYFDAIQVGDIETLELIEKTVEDPKRLFIHPTRTQLKSVNAMAAYYGQNHIIKHFIDKFDILIHDAVMVAAIKGGQIDTMVFLNQKVPEKQRIALNVRYKELIFNGGKYYDLTLMHVAAFFGQIRMMVFLHQNSKVPPSEHVPYNVKSSIGVTPMHMAAAGEQIDTMIFLRKDWRVPTDECTPYNIKDNRGITPIHFAASSGKINSMIFLNSDRRVSEPTSYDDQSDTGCTLMHAAAGCGQVMIMPFLANQGLGYDAKSNQGYTPMHAAAVGGHLNTMIYLNENPAVPVEQRTAYDVKAEGDITPLNQAIAKGHSHIINFLKEKWIEAPTSLTVNSVKNLREVDAVERELEEQTSQQNSEIWKANKRSVPPSDPKLNSSPSNSKNKRQKTNSNSIVGTVDALDKQGFLARPSSNSQASLRNTNEEGKITSSSGNLPRTTTILPESEEPEEPQEISGGFGNH